MIHLIHRPHPPGYGDLVSHRGWLDDGAQFLRAGADGIFDIFLKDRIKLVIIDDPLSFQADDEPAVPRSGRYGPILIRCRSKIR